ncbi:MAG: hypothetical protein ABIG44_14015 [Planctomycetota bacterium]
MALKELIEEAHESGKPDRIAAAEALQAKFDEVLNSYDHKWFLGKMDPAEKARRTQSAEEFNTRYKD